MSGVMRGRTSSTSRLMVLLGAVALALLLPGAVYCQLASGKPAPLFSMEDLHGGVYSLSDMTEHSMLILYFCDVKSPSSQGGLLALDKTAREHPGVGVNIWAVALSSREDVGEFLARHELAFPLLPDISGIGTIYQAASILPTTYIITKGEEDPAINDFIQGGGRTTEILLQRVIETGGMTSSKEGRTPFDELKAKGIGAFERKDFQTAFDYLARALALKSDADASLYVAYTLMELKKDKEVEESLTRAIKAYPEDLRLYKVYVQYLIAHDQQKKAKSLLNRALELNPDDPTLNALKEITAGGEKGNR